jgi:propionyl-CoA carboxylase alpha chain
VTIAGRTRRISFASALADGRRSRHGRRRAVPRPDRARRARLRVVHDGARVEARVLTPRAAELLALMPFKPPPDLSRFLLSPMPGLLVNVAVEVGQAVRAASGLP